MELHVSQGTRKWLPSADALDKIEGYFGPKIPEAEIWVVPRSMEAEIMGQAPPAPYSFRAVTRGNRSYVLVDGTETPDSVAFLIAHELAHQALRKILGLKEALAEARPSSQTPWDDHFHEVDPEERYCDGIAARILGTWYDRDWWREQVQWHSISF